MTGAINVNVDRAPGPRHRAAPGIGEEPAASVAGPGTATVSVDVWSAAPPAAGRLRSGR